MQPRAKTQLQCLESEFWKTLPEKTSKYQGENTSFDDD
jgi:hypothetical protein